MPLNSDKYIKLSVLIITKNAETVIGKALKSAKGLWDELVVVDTGSADKTVEISKKYTKKVFQYPFQNNFSDPKNFGLTNICGDWILALDADERVSDKMRKQVPKLTKRKDIDAYWFRRKTFLAPDKYLRYGLFYPDYQLRLFRNKKGYRYRGAVHEQLTIPKEKTKEVSYDILHYPQHPKYTSFGDFRNLMPYIQIQAKELRKTPKSVFGLFIEGTKRFIELFFGGFIRGKGFLDGWAGFRAHLMFASSVGLSYLLAAWKKAKRDYVH